MHLPLPRVCRKLLSCLDIDREKSPKLKEYEHILAAQGPANDKEPQATPPAATLLDFPCYITTGETTPFAELSPDQFRNLFLSIKNSSDITSEHLAAINLDTDIDVVLDELIPKSFADGEPRFLSDSTRELPGEDTEVPFSDRPSRALSNESEAPGRDIYDERLKELSFDNDDAFRAVRRLPALPGRPSTRLAHFRKFWINLDMMSQYWDTSEDNTEPYDEQSHIHHGRRIGTGREMPEQYREDTIKFFVEPIAWKFGCQVRAPTINPRLAVQTILFPVRHSLVVYRMPAERMRTRASNLEGPLIGVQCRPVTKFRNDGQALGEGNAEKVDLLREVSAMLLLAQERARAGKMEMKPGEGKWWTTKPRWGGKAGGESGAATGNSDEATPVRVGRGSRRVPSRRKQEAGRSYQTLSPGPGLWDKKVTYVQVGKNESDNFDDIFMVSSINHHISILKLRVHPFYLKFLEAGVAPPSASSQPLENDGNTQPSSAQTRTTEEQHPWYVLKLQRTRWYDLFSVEDRVEAMKGVWGVLTWLMRGKEGDDVEMTDQSID